MTRYTCPACGLSVEVDTDTLNWDADGNGRIVHDSCDEEITIARPISVGFGGGDETPEREEIEDCPMCGGPAREGGGMCHDCLSLNDEQEDADGA